MKAPSKHSHGRSEAQRRASRWLAESKLLAQRLKELRELRGMTQERLAEAAGLHVKSVSRLEQGEVNATLATLVGVADALAIPLAGLFGEQALEGPGPLEPPTPGPRQD